MTFDRQSGVFLHPTSLPSPHGIGDFGEGARAFVDFLATADQSLWQFCPLGPTSGAHANSPYQSYSAFAGNPLLIDLRELADQGYLTDAEIEPPDDVSDRTVHYDRVAEFKSDALRAAHERFQESAADADRASLDRFVEEQAAWIEDYALFMALKTAFDGAIWTEWPEAVRLREADALDRYREELSTEIAFRTFVQWQFDRQWQALADYAAEHGVSLVGDLPIYVALDSADVWANPDRFLLDDDNQPTDVAGVPPNPGDDGQRWGNPLYDWETLREQDYDWWIDRLERLLEQVDVARIDHFKGFDEFWAIPAESDRPDAGRWVEGPGAEFFETVESELGSVPFFVEDLGFIDERLVELRNQFDFPSMRVPQYADWCEEGNMYQPMHFPEAAVGYTSTHDTNTFVGYYQSLSDRQRECLHYNLGTDGTEIHWELIEAVWNSDAAVAVTTVQDLLGLGSDARFNTPGTTSGNWQWRTTTDDLDPDVARRLRQITDWTIR